MIHSPAITTVITYDQQAKIRRFLITLTIALAVFTILSWFSGVDASSAETGAGNDFDALVTWVRGQLEGSAGKFIALLGFAIALASGLIKGSVAGIVFGLALALSAAYGPGLLMGIFTATF
jgi:conjugal transfer pilus assembly protein TraA